MVICTNPFVPRALRLQSQSNRHRHRCQDPNQSSLHHQNSYPADSCAAALASSTVCCRLDRRMHGAPCSTLSQNVVALSWRSHKKSYCQSSRHAVQGAQLGRSQSSPTSAAPCRLREPHPQASSFNSKGSCLTEERAPREKSLQK